MQPKIYSLKIVPPEPVYSDVVKFKDQFIQTFGKQELSKSKPHITLFEFEMFPDQEEHLINSVSKLKDHQRFLLKTNGFDIFKGSKTLFLDVLDSKELKAICSDFNIIWYKDLLSANNSLKTADKFHITISKTKDDIMLDESIELFKPKEYNKQFEVLHLVLTSRPPYKTWDSEHIIKLS